MNKAEFIRRLTELLGDVPLSEREAAIQYYNDYFDDAGAENESSVIASLGTPEELARTIKAGLNDGGNGGEFTESGFSGYAQIHKDEVMKTGDTVHQAGNAGYQDAGYQKTTPPKQGMTGGTIALIVILAVLTSPLWIGVLGGLFGTVVGIVAAMFGIFLALLIIGVVFVAVAIALIVTGVVVMFSAPLAGISMIGTALVLFAGGLVCIWLMVLTAAMAIPALVKGIAALGRKLFHRGGATA